jgi:bifunctional non-homologous end joining protein LigD
MAKFMVHEHHASHLHFDFRIQLQGVFKSWAVPKGPSMNPSDKRLAIMVEDHPLEYGSFEGVIPEGQYGAGRVAIWDSGRYSVLDGDIRSGRLEFNLQGKKLKGIFVLAKMKGKEKEWLLIKKNDAYADRLFTLKTVLAPKDPNQKRTKKPPCRQ